MTGIRDWDLLRKLRRAKSERAPTVQFDRPLRSLGLTERPTDRDEDMGRLQDIKDSRGHPISLPKLRFMGEAP